jgi:hypothetical protein
MDATSARPTLRAQIELSELHVAGIRATVREMP